MKNKILKILVIILLIIPIMVKAASVKYRPDAINKANNYIRLAKFSDRKKYIDLDTDKYVYEDGYITSISDYKTGGMLSKTEYELSKSGDMSYLTLGQKYWTLTPAGSGKRYYVENYLDDKAESEEAGVRSTIFAKSEVYVVGKGTYNIPWEFKLFHTVKITPKAYGSIECLESNCKKVKTTVVKDKIESGSDASFKVIPDDGYKYLANDSCNLKRTSGQNYKISNITSDIRCIVEFYPRTYTLKLMPGTGVQYRQNPGKDKIYLKYTVGTFSDPDAKNPLTFVSPPTRIGYQFRGYYYGDTKVIEDNGTIIESQRKSITGFDLAGEDIQELVAHWEPNKIHITFDPNEGVDYNTAQHQIPVTVTRLYDGTNYSGTDGLPNYACSKDACWWGLSRTGYHGTNFWLVDSKTETSSTPKINVNTSFAKNQDMFTGTQKTSFEDNYNTNVTLYAQWIQCAEGTYMDEEASGTSCKSCPAGTFQPNTTQGSCTECAVASITTSQGQTSCTPCQPSGATGSSGTTSSRGQTSCNDSCNKTHVLTWKNQIWTNNSTSPICEINSCVDGYHIEDNTCVPNELVITYNANGGADQRGTNSIPYTVTLKYDGTTYSGSSGLPNYSCTSECFWNLSRGGYHGTSDWLVGSTTSTTKINANTAFATNQDVASAIGKLDDFKTKASTTVNLYAEWVKCNEGKFNPSDRSGTTCVDCAIGSITSSKGQSSCSACQPSGATGSNGTTSTVGLSSCDTSCNKSNVGEWETQEWTNNKTEPICQIKSCATGYHLSSGSCVPNELVITYNANEGTDQRGANSIPYTVTLKYDGTTYSGENGLPNYACTGNCAWKLSRAGYHGTSDWLVGSTSSTTKINVDTPFATNQDVASAMGKLSDFQTKASTTVNLYAEWVECEAGEFNPSDRSGTTCVNCAVGSITTAKKQSSCAACQPSGATGTSGTTSSAGKSSCDASCNKTHVSTWETASWSNNSITNKCTIKTCESGWTLSNNTCVDTVAPSCTVTKSGTYSTGGVTTTVTCTDNQSGCSSSNPTGDSSLTSNKTYTVYDNAGNSATCSVTVSSVRQQRTRTCSYGYRCEAAGCEERNSCVDDSCPLNGCPGGYTQLGDGKCIKGAGYGNIGPCRAACTGWDLQVCCSPTGEGTDEDSFQSWWWHYPSHSSCVNDNCSCKTWRRSISACGCEAWNDWGSWNNVSSCSSNNSSECRTLYY